MATKADVIAVIAYISAGIQKTLSKESIAVYCDLLIDLPCETLQSAAQRVLLNHKWATFPSIAEIREAATLTSESKVVEITPGEAWGLAWSAIGRIDPDITGSYERHTKDLPPLVHRAMLTFGIRTLIHCDKVDVARSQFLRVYEGLLSSHRQRSLLPSKLSQRIESGAASGSLPAVAMEAIKTIGVER